MAINVAVIGAGYWGPNLIRNFAQLENANLIAVCDLDRARLVAVEAQYPGVRTTTQLPDILSDANIEAVVVATPAETHCDLVTSALETGKHVFVEKPMAENSADAAHMARLAERKGLVLMVGHIFLFQAAMAKLIQLVGEGAIGEIRYAHGVRTSMSGTARLDTNIVWDALAHDAYILPALFGGPPRRVQAVGGRYLSADLEDVAFVTFDFGEERLAHIYASWYALAKARQLVVIGSEAILQYDDLAPSRLTHFQRRYQRSDALDPQGRPRWNWQDAGSEVVPLEPVEPLQAECRHFLSCISNGRQPLTNGSSGLLSVQLLEACQQSLETGNVWVELT